MDTSHAVDDYVPQVAVVVDHTEQARLRRSELLRWSATHPFPSVDAPTEEILAWVRGYSPHYDLRMAQKDLDILRAEAVLA